MNYLDYNAQAVGEGKKITKGKTTDIDSVVFFVEKKLDNPDNPIPKEIDGKPTDVIETGGEILPMNFRSRVRPVKGGTSGKVEGGSACSIGAIVFKDGEPHILTNSHCTHFGMDRTMANFLQPSPLDGGKILKDEVGVIKNPSSVQAGKINKIDSNIVPLNPKIPYSMDINQYGHYPKKWLDPKVGMRFKKVGRTTGITQGVVSHINVTASVNFSFQNQGVIQFYPCFFALQDNWNIVNGGDSGSCVFTEDGVIGQTFAAAPNLAIFMPFRSIVEELGITLGDETGYIALGQWLDFYKLEITTKFRTNFRAEAGLNGQIIRTLPAGTKLEIIADETLIKDNYFWLKVKVN